MLLEDAECEMLISKIKGEFLCGHCGKTFCHAASLNRHRLNFHGDDQHCQLCDAKIPGFRSDLTGDYLDRDSKDVL
ncbi:zinc finger, C2H2 type [Necator americanus]|uniref:Zinc finger, C2H2 type n=1 Tax=Necator americanus TaxID=51031 RepID=W2T388_NECAM|nr:zinc finger, C2H2 type [Necator americanus]ETN76353.1 zinc finger, C2H2 type [Necator americanus]